MYTTGKSIGCVIRYDKYRMVLSSRVTLRYVHVNLPPNDVYFDGEGQRGCRTCMVRVR